MKIFLTAVLLLEVLLCSCSRYYYVPNLQNVPLFKEKKETRVSAAFGGGDESECFEAQAAYSITGNMGIMTNFMSVKGGDGSEPVNARGNYFDGALGFYKPAGRIGVFEIYGGFGRCNQHHEYGTGNGDSDLSFNNIFLQPSFGITLNFFDLAVSTRINRLSFLNIVNNINTYTTWYTELNNLTDKKHYFFEPSVTLRAGWKNVKVQLQYVYSNYLNDPRLYFGEESHISLGLYLSFADRYKKDVPEK